jgi:UDP-N-acetylglucosamine--N-acetylmuramyl-(pentapeptide) pyrophosphoryl-undecaprenol N-acetylglucosamine transferase
MARSAVTVLAGSPGGHLDLLTAVGPSLDGAPRVWVTAPGPQADDLERRGERVERLPEYGRSPIRVLPNLARAIAVLRRVRPAVVVASGASLVVPFCVLAWLSGARLVFIETTARVGDASMSGRVIGRLASAVLVQWEETAARYRRAVLCRPALWEQIRREDGTGGVGTFVAVGTRKEPFDRLLAAVDEAVGAGVLPAPVVVQSGASRYRPRHFEPVPWLAPAQVEAAAASARYVVCHSGSGIIGAALRSGRRPLVLPRRRDHGEHVDDHQVQIARKLEAMGLAVALEDAPIEPAHVRAADAPLPDHTQSGVPSVADALQLAVGRERIAA